MSQGFFNGVKTLERLKIGDRLTDQFGELKIIGIDGLYIWLKRRGSVPTTARADGRGIWLNHRIVTPPCAPIPLGSHEIAAIADALSKTMIDALFERPVEGRSKHGGRVQSINGLIVRGLWRHGNVATAGVTELGEAVREYLRATQGEA